MSSVTLSNLSKKFADGTLAVDELNLTVNDGEFVVLLGPSGCGKTTTLQMIAGLERETSGDVYFDDERVNRLPTHRRDIAMVFQSYALYPNMNVYKNMAFGLKIRGTSRDEIQHRVEETARILGIHEFLTRRPAQLSGGQRQRVALGRAIVRQPRVFLLDEPLSNVDAKLRSQMRLELKSLHQRLQSTFVYVTHDQVEAMSMGDRIAIMSNGVLQQFDTPNAIYHSPANLFVAGFIGSPAMNLLHGKISVDSGSPRFVSANFEYTWRTATWPAALAGRSITFGVRPTDVKVTHVNEDHGDVRAPVEFDEPLGSDLLLTLKLGDGRRLVVRTDPDFGAAAGDLIDVEIPEARVHLFDSQTGERISAPMRSEMPV